MSTLIPGSKRILVVDDNPDARNLLRRTLAGTGHSVTEVATGEEGLRQLREASFDLALVDILMPGMTGLELLREIRGNDQWARLPVILVSALDDVDSVVAGLADGANDYITKPITKPILIARVNTHLNIGSLIAELEQQRNLLARLAAVDDLTRVTNRRVFGNMLEKEIRRSDRHGHRLSLMIMDIDHFKQVNDQYGHLVGDEVLKEFARRVAATIRASDVLARYGGEEFCILLPETDSDKALRFAERCREAIARTAVKVRDHAVAVTMSAGVVTAVPDRTTRGEHLLARADKALYEAKAAGRNQVCVAAS